MYYFSAYFLKICVKSGLTLYEIGKLMSESVFEDCESGVADQDNEITELIKCATRAIDAMDEFDNKSLSLGDNNTEEGAEMGKPLKQGGGCFGISGGSSMRSMKS